VAFDFINDKLLERRNKALFRERVCVEHHNNGTSDEAGSIVIDGKTFVNFSSNDYLGLNHHPKINQAMSEGVERFGASASASSLVTGYHYAHQSLEETICTWLNKSHCLLFASGFSANVALFDTIGKQYNNNQPQFFLDKLSHASMIDGARSSEALVKRFSHNDITHLDTLLTNNPSKNNLIASEGVFSMDGDQAKVSQLALLANKHDAWLFLDDAHSIGVIGDKGQGSASIANTDITMATFGKAIATSGAFLACEKNVYEYLVNFGRHYIYSTAISPAIAWATKASIELIIEEQWRRDKIEELSDLFVSLLDEKVEILKSESSIHAIIIGDELKTLYVSQQLKNAGIWVTAIRPPTVPVGTSRLRVTICASHNSKDIKKLATEINKAII
jgi:8-amino-7-oxononanoate synthase